MADKKQWAVLHYLVALVDTNQGDDDMLRQEAEEEIARIVAAGKQHFADMHVAYQVEFRDRPEPSSTQRVIQARRAKVTSAKTVREEPVTPLVGGTLQPTRADDLERFFEWTRDATGFGDSPSEHIAVFFWGHSAGPAGIFDLLEGSTFDAGAASSPAFHIEVELPKFVGAFRGLRQVCDLALFKDCWMSTLELVCEIRGRVRSVIASQSQVPIRPDWPYDTLYASLAALSHGSGVIPTSEFRPLFSALVDFYKAPATRSVNGEVFFPSVPFALLDIDKSLEIAESLSALVRQLGTNKSKFSVEQRESRRAFDDAATGPLPGVAGDIALVDVKTLCAGLSTFPFARSAAEAVGAAVDDIVVAPTGVRAEEPCKGISLFYKPANRIEPVSPGGSLPIGAFGPSFLVEAVRFNFYKKLKLNQVVAKAERWMDVAFEQPLPATIVVHSVKGEDAIMPEDSKGPGFGLTPTQLTNLKNRSHDASMSFDELAGMANASNTPEVKQNAEAFTSLKESFERISDIWNEASTNAAAVAKVALAQAKAEVVRLQTTHKEIEAIPAARRTKKRAARPTKRRAPKRK